MFSLADYRFLPACQKIDTAEYFTALFSLEKLAMFYIFIGGG